MKPLATLTTFLPIDRCHAEVARLPLPDSACGAALFADISGFTPLTEALLRALGPRRGAEELTHQLNIVYEALINEVHRFHGSVIGFSGDAITCWLDGDDGTRAVACALAMQHAMQQFTDITLAGSEHFSLAMKAAVASGSVRRFVVGDAQIQRIDVLAGATLDRMAAAERHALRGEVVVAPDTAAHLGARLRVAEWRTDTTGEPGEPGGEAFAVVAALDGAVASEPWPPAPAADAQQMRPWILPPVFSRLQAGQAQYLAEIRPAVALFLSFDGIEYDHDPQAGARLDRYIQWVQNILARYEGFLLQLTMGDKGSYLYASFGAPLAHDDDPARAIAAALDLLALPPDLAYIRNSKAGISRGLMHSGAYGSPRRHTYGVLGDEVNLAARLMSKATPGQILVSGRIAYNTDHIYHLEPIGLMTVKGKREPVPVSLVRGRSQPGQHHATQPYTSALVGREAELARFDTLLDAVQQGSGAIVRLEGVAGIGKSHMVAAFDERARRRGVRVVQGACQSISQNIAYTPWRQVFWVLLGLAERAERAASGNEVETETTRMFVAEIEARICAMNPDWLLRLPLLGDLLGLPIADNATTAGFDPQFRQEALVSLLIDMLHTVSRGQPLLLLLEDVHWMDEASLTLTLALGRVVGPMPLLLTLVQRPPLQAAAPLLPELAGLPWHHHIVLAELALAGVAQLVASRLHAPASPLALALIQAEAQGNPFFVEELVDMLREDGRLTRSGTPSGEWHLADTLIDALREAQCLVRNEQGEWDLVPNPPLSAVELGIPDSIQGIVLSRLDRLPEEHKLTLKVASVIGRIFEVDVLAHIHPSRLSRAELLAQIQMAESRDFTRVETPLPHLTYIFKHSVTQEMAYETLLDSQRRDLHGVVGTTLEQLQPEAVEQMAYHFSRSGLRDKTLHYLDLAARKTQRDYANETALLYYAQALALEERWQWRQGQVEILHTLGRRDEQQQALLQLERLADAPQYAVAYLWGQYYEAVSDYRQAQAAVERALEDCRARRDPVCEARSLAQLGMINYRRGDYDAARAWYDQALARLTSDSDSFAHAPHIFVDLLSGMGLVCRQQGDFEQARACFAQALDVSRASDHRRGEAAVLNSLGGLFAHQRNVAEALTHFRAALDIQRAIGDRPGEGASLGNMANAIQVMGDYSQASQQLAAAQAIHQAIGNRWNEINDWNDMGLIAQELGDLARAQECLQQGLRLSQEIGDEGGQAYILANMGLVARDQGNLDEAEVLLRRGLALAQAQDDTTLVAGFTTYLSTINLRRGNLEEAIRQAQAALATLQELDLHLDTTHNLAVLAQAYLRSQQPEQARAYAQQALEVLDSCGGEGPEFPQEDYYRCAQVCAAVGETQRAQHAQHMAYTLVMRRAETIADPAQRQSFLQRVAINRQIVAAQQTAGA